MPRRNKLPTGHLTPSDIIRHDDGSTVIAYNDGYQPPVAAEPPAETPNGIPLPPTLKAKHVLLEGIGEACHWDEERRREEAEAEDWLINILAEQKVYVGSRTYIHSIPLFTPASYETKRMTRKLMLLPSAARSTLAETNDILDYLVSHFASKRYVVREWVFAGGFHLVWKPGEDAFEAGKRLRTIVRKFQTDVGDVSRDASVAGSALIPFYRKTEVCFYKRDDGAVILSLHAHCLLACKGRLIAKDWFGRLTRAKK